MSERGEGSVFHYPYLWRDLVRHGIEQTKDRVTTIALSVRRLRAEDGQEVIHLLLLGITDNPRDHQTAIEIPAIEKRRAGLDPARPAFVVISEYNYDRLPGSHDYNPRSKTYGRFSAAFVAHLKQELGRLIHAKRAKRTDRAER